MDVPIQGEKDEGQNKISHVKDVIEALIIINEVAIIIGKGHFILGAILVTTNGSEGIYVGRILEVIVTRI